MLKYIEKYSASLLAFPFMVTIALFFILPLFLVVIVSFWDYTSYSIVLILFLQITKTYFTDVSIIFPNYAPHFQLIYPQSNS